MIDSELKIQNNLLILGSQLAGSKKKLRYEETKRLEKLIDKLTKTCQNWRILFIPKDIYRWPGLYADAPKGKWWRQKLKDKNVLKYLNRLSDALFTMARWVNFKRGYGRSVEKVNYFL